MKEVIIAYQKLQKNLTKVIDKSGFKTDYIAKRIGMTSGNFYVKKRRGSWSDEEMLKILEIIENDETENYLLGQIISEVRKEEDGNIDELMAVLKA
ncbi:hypothetical protein [Niabella ginsengisoli]|uniref:XRE family transcriptional regulator n=1 Tax=Niabella ginsengisoli TaxID=522298 RepID=A0ABS9SIW0_9BACT|nr:hypothetical protein [Niabella ginsengisoli]MCH5598114.1 hypothetical protein [Niabella ginsengisoli]